jgi:hypothetical protein
MGPKMATAHRPHVIKPQDQSEMDRETYMAGNLNEPEAWDTVGFPPFIQGRGIIKPLSKGAMGAQTFRDPSHMGPFLLFLPLYLVNLCSFAHLIVSDFL